MDRIIFSLAGVKLRLIQHSGGKQMGNLKSPTKFWVCTSGTWQVIVREAGSGGYLGQNIVTTTPSSPPYRLLRSGGFWP
jgi:hypothetical protein